jgi:hypothetical protein
MDEIRFIVSRHLDYPSKISVFGIVQIAQPSGIAISTLRTKT